MIEWQALLANNLMHKDDHTPYEATLYVQLLTTLTAQARFNELISRMNIEAAKNGQRTDQNSRGTPPSTPEAEEY